eukprot:8794083-Pyramimonas_sp.AAC.1
MGAASGPCAGAGPGAGPARAPVRPLGLGAGSDAELGARIGSDQLESPRRARASAVRIRVGAFRRSWGAWEHRAAHGSAWERLG